MDCNKIEKRSVTSQNSNLLNYKLELDIQKEQDETRSLAKNEPVSENWGDLSTVIVPITALI